MRQSISIPTFALSDEQLMEIANTIMAVENELLPERGPDPQGQLCVEAIMAVLDQRATATYSIRYGKIIREA